MPASLLPLWQAWTELHAARGSNGFGPNPINYHDVLAWQQVSGVRLSHWEADTLLQMDRAALATQAKGTSP